MCLEYCLVAIHVQVKKVGTIYIEDCRQTATHLGHWHNKVCSMPLISMCGEDHDTDNALTCRRSAISLSQSLCLHLNAWAGEFPGVPKCCSKEEFHFLYHLQHCHHCHVLDTKGLKNEQRHGVCNVVIAVGGINWCDCCWDPKLMNNVIEQSFYQPSIVGRRILITKSLLQYKIVFSSHLQCPYTIRFLVNSIKICLHWNNSSEFWD
jgi:hypothetical protein